MDRSLRYQSDKALAERKLERRLAVDLTLTDGDGDGLEVVWRLGMMGNVVLAINSSEYCR